jgi:hypothetical protein
VIDPHGDVIAAAPVDVKDKIEGLTARRDGGRIHALLVTDADDPDKPSPLLEARF